MSKDSPAVSRQIVQTTWHGPLPPPETLEQFKRLVPDAPERILRMAEEEARVRREIMKRDSESQNLRKGAELREYHRDVSRGQRVAFCFLVLDMMAAVACAYLGSEKIGVTIAGMGAAGIVSNFIWRKK